MPSVQRSYPRTQKTDRRSKVQLGQDKHREGPASSRPREPGAGITPPQAPAHSNCIWTRPAPDSPAVAPGFQSPPFDMSEPLVMSLLPGPPSPVPWSVPHSAHTPRLSPPSSFLQSTTGALFVHRLQTFTLERPPSSHAPTSASSKPRPGPRPHFTFPALLPGALSVTLLATPRAHSQPLWQ